MKTAFCEKALQISSFFYAKIKLPFNSVSYKLSEVYSYIMWHISLRTFYKVELRANLPSSSTASLNFRIKWGCQVIHFILLWHAISIVHTSLKSHKNNYKIINTAFFKRESTKAHLIAKSNLGQCSICC